MPSIPPDDLPTWAASPSDPSDVEEPPAATQASGWQSIKPPRNWVNWWWNLISDWVTHMARNGAVFSDLDDAVDYADATLVANDTLMVFEDDGTTGPGVSVANTTSGGSGNLGGIAVSGDLVVPVIGTTTPVGFSRDLGTTIAIYNRANSGQNFAVVTDGSTTIIAYDQYVEAFNALTGIQIWIHDNDVAVGDMCMAAGFLYIVHQLSAGTGDGTANRQCHKLSVATGAVVWSFRHSNAAGTLLSCCTNGRQLFLAGQASDYASGATLRAIRTSDGFDATGEANNGDADDGITWNQVTSVHPEVGQMDCDGSMLYQGQNSAAAKQLEARGQGDGVIAWSVAHPDASANSANVAVDQDFVIMCTTDGGSPSEGYVEAYDKRTGALSWRFASTAFTPDHAACIAAASDGCAVYTLGDDDTEVRKITRGNVPTRFRKVNGLTNLPHYQNLKLQPEAQ